MEGTAWLVLKCVVTQFQWSPAERPPLHAKHLVLKELQVLLTHLILTTTYKVGVINPILQMAVIV